mgnify:CR=1 FL=1
MLTDLPKYYCELRYNFIPAIIKGILAVQYGKAKLINLMKMFSKYFAEITINIANFCITCNGSIAVQSLKTRTVCSISIKVNYVTKKTIFPILSQNKNFLRVFNFKKIFLC